jgi:hypothetical protein
MYIFFALCISLVSSLNACACARSLCQQQCVNVQPRYHHLLRCLVAVYPTPVALQLVGEPLHSDSRFGIWAARRVSTTDHFSSSHRSPPSLPRSHLLAHNQAHRHIRCIVFLYASTPPLSLICCPVCGQATIRAFVVRRAGENQGRRFYKCPNSVCFYISRMFIHLYFICSWGLIKNLHQFFRASEVARGLHNYHQSYAILARNGMSRLCRTICSTSHCIRPHPDWFWF